ncbi:metallophosphoesterase family protein [Chloroflexota bacterium]
MDITMRIGIISDVHGNLHALDAVLHEIQAEGANDVVCLGDVAAFGPQPHEVIARLRGLRLQPALCAHFVMGNTDAWLLDPVAHQTRDADTQKVTEVEMWASRQLTRADRAFIHAFQQTVGMELDGGLSLLCFHGSPKSASGIIEAATPEDELERMLGGETAAVMAGGHTHAQMLRRHGEVMLINPGSVGLPYQMNRETRKVCHPRWAEYAVLDVKGASLNVAFRRVPYDHQQVVAQALVSGMPHAEWWVTEFGTAR